MAETTSSEFGRLRIKRDKNMTELSRTCMAGAVRYRACADKLEMAAREFGGGRDIVGYEYLKGAEKALDNVS